MTDLRTALPASIDTTFGLDHHATARTVIRQDFYRGLLDGTEPFIRTGSLPHTMTAADALPADAEIERAATDEAGVALIARGPGTTIHLEVGVRDTTIRVSAATDGRAADVLKGLIEMGQLTARPHGAPTTFWWRHPSGNVGQARRWVDTVRWDDIRVNYPTATRTALDQLVALRQPTSSASLILWHGEPGTGKTTALRSLISEWSAWCYPNYISDPEKFFEDAAFMSTVLSQAPRPDEAPTLIRANEAEESWRLIIAEDADAYLRSSARRDAGAALGRLLNLTDGILGQGTNVLVLLTTNDELARLHPAISRPGRCLAATHFDRFPPHEAAAWLGSRGQSSVSATTLAELLALRGDLSQPGSAAPPAIGAYL